MSITPSAAVFSFDITRDKILLSKVYRFLEAEV